MKPPKFLADHMNGDLARWLRILGFDCLYPDKGLNDKEIYNLCVREGRILLTRDKELHSYALRKGIKSIFITGNTLIEKFEDIYREVNLNKYIEKLTPRCTICNEELKRIDPKNLKTKIYKDIIERYNLVYYCPRCDKIYWEGSHWQGISKTVSKIKSLGNKKNDKIM